MRVLVTGHLGFLGHHTTESLLARGHEVIGVDRVEQAVSDKSERIAIQAEWKFRREQADLSDLNAVMDLVGRYRPQAIVHTAAQYSVKYTTESCVRYVRNNLDAFTWLFQAAQTHKVGRIVYASSTAISDAGRPSGLYGATKAYGEHCAHAYTARSSMYAVGLRFGPIYGPLVRPDAEVFRVLSHYLAGKPVPYSTALEKSGAYVSVLDAARVMADMVSATLPEKHNVFLTVADDHHCSLTDVVRCAEAVTGRPARWPEGFTPRQRSTQRPDLTPLHQVLGYVPGTTLEQGIPHMLEWMQRRKAA